MLTTKFLDKLIHIVLHFFFSIRCGRSPELERSSCWSLLKIVSTICFVFSSVLSNRLLLNIITMQFAVTGPGKLTVGKLYGGILIYEIWKTTRFSNLEILAKVTTITNCICIASTSSS